MKLKNITSQKSKLIRLQLIKFKFYKQNRTKKKETQSFCFEYIELNLKKVLQIIYNYNQQNKKIFFIGLPETIQTRYLETLDQTNHLFLPESIWVKGILSNKASIFKYLQKKTNLTFESKKFNFQTLFTIQQKPDLVLLFDKDLETEAFKEAVKLKIPIVAIVTKFNTDKNILYPIYGNFSFLKKSLNNIYISLLNSVLKKIQ